MSRHQKIQVLIILLAAVSACSLNQPQTFPSPSISIRRPTAEKKFSINDYITFEAEVSSTLFFQSELTTKWYKGSNQLGVGRIVSIGARDLAVGIHTITATVEDPNGNTDSDSVPIEIVEPEDAIISIQF
ncbi:MAG: hypothetical protein AB7S52_08390 [Sphaerochaetaceae bacterium]